ncbi:MAG: type VII secretion target [Actinomycetota bacterium]|nr:type VII secretion target [Actinomycetota bacterium]
MPVPLSADTDALRGYGSASAGHAADLRAAAARLDRVGADATVFGPVGAVFLAALRRAVARETETLGGLSRTVTESMVAAHGSAQAYEVADGVAGDRIAGGW